MPDAAHVEALTSCNDNKISWEISWNLGFRPAHPIFHIHIPHSKVSRFSFREFVLTSLSHLLTARETAPLLWNVWPCGISKIPEVLFLPSMLAWNRIRTLPRIGSTPVYVYILHRSLSHFLIQVQKMSLARYGTSTEQFKRDSQHSHGHSEWGDHRRDLWLLTAPVECKADLEGMWDNSKTKRSWNSAESQIRAWGCIIYDGVGRQLLTTYSHYGRLIRVWGTQVLEVSTLTLRHYVHNHIK